ncbi:MAG: DUF5702 domain-containing protein [Eubacteriales bacterium]|nr:DUF5702 domain-containing protein [Eubacteriales bacterium]
MLLIRLSRKGATSVFLSMIAASMLLLTGLFIQAASHAAGRSYADAVFDLAGRSILSEYDVRLHDRYGIFAIHTDEGQAEEKIKYYADYSFHDNTIKEMIRGRDYLDLFRLKLESVHVDLKGYAMTDTVTFERQILEYMKYGIVKELLSEEKEYAHRNSETALRNEQIINSLPSNGYRSNLISDMKSIVANGIPSLQEIQSETRDLFLINEYIMRHFLNHQRGHETRDTFFSNEVEYILKGNFNDRENYKAVRNDLFIMRNILNLMHINSDPEKKNQVEAVAAVLTLAEGKEIGALFVAEAWAAAETENDLRLLEDGKQVAFLKNKQNWAVPLSGTLEFLWKEDYEKPKSMKGYEYEEYLRILLFVENSKKKLLRCMDLIQLNMKGSYYRDFNLEEYYGGFRFEVVTRDHMFTYMQQF